MRPAILLAILLSGCLSSSSGGASEVDLVFINGEVWTPEGMASAVAVKDGQIVAFGQAAVAHASSTKRVADLDGGWVLPGLRDQHMHLLEVAAAAAPGENPYAPVYTPYNPEGAEANNADNLLGQAPTPIINQLDNAGTPTQGEMGCAYTEPTPELQARIRFGAEQAASQGLTTVVEARLRDLGHLDALAALQERGELPLRFLIRMSPGCVAAMGEPFPEGDHIKFLGLKLYADGYLGSRAAALREPYSDLPGWSGVLNYNDQLLDQHLATARASGWNVATHAIGDAAIEQVLDAYDRAGVTAADRWAIEHVQVLDPQLLARFTELGVVANIQASFATTDQNFAPARLGDRIDTAYPWADMVSEGVAVVVSSDFPNEVLNPWWGIQRMVTRQELDGSAPFQPEQRLGFSTVLELMSYAPAWASFEENRGRIQVGAPADLTVLAAPITGEAATKATVVMTVIDGVVAWEGRQQYLP